MGDDIGSEFWQWFRSPGNPDGLIRTLLDLGFSDGMGGIMPAKPSACPLDAPGERRAGEG